MSVALIAAFLVAAAESQPTGDIFNILEEEELVTTGSRVATKASESPSSVWVVDRTMIENTAATTIADLLRRVPGLIPLELAVGDTYIASRGLGAETGARMLFLIDGRSVLGEAYGITDVNGLPIDIEDIERIEVVLGPASTLYGTNAFSGVINFITREAVRNGYRVRANVRGGAEWDALSGKSYGAPGPLGKGYLEYSQAVGDFRVRASLGATYVEGPHSTDANTITQPEPLRRVNGMVDATYEHNDWTFRLQFTGGVKKSTALVTNISHPTRDTWEDYGLSFTAKRKNLIARGDELSLQLWGRENTFENYVFLDKTYPTADITSHTWTGEFLAQYNSPVFYYNRLITGVQVREFDVDAPGVLAAGRTQNVVGIFLEDQFRPIDPLIFTLGVRVETRNTAGYKAFAHTDVAPRGAIVFIPAPGHSLRAEVTTAFRDPSVLESFQTIQTNTLVLVQSNSAVKAEQHVMAQVGYQGHVSWFKPRADVFWGDKLNLITLQTRNGATLPLFYDNSSNTQYYGVTVYADATPLPWLDIFAQYTFYEARPQNVKGFFAPLSGHVVTTAPRQTGGGGVTVTLGRWVASLQLYVIGDSQQYDLTSLAPVSIKGRLLVNPLVRYTIDSAGRFRVYAAGTNVADFRFGHGADTDVPNDQSERIGPRVWAGFDMTLP